jgi:hypothetical protein
MIDMRIGFFLGLFLGWLVTCIVWAYRIETNIKPGIVAEEQAKAIEAGVAEYQVDPKTGGTEFVYLTLEELRYESSK